MELKFSCGWPAKGTPSCPIPTQKWRGETSGPGLGNRSKVTGAWRQWLPSEASFLHQTMKWTPVGPWDGFLRTPRFPSRFFEQVGFYPKFLGPGFAVLEPAGRVPRGTFDKTFDERLAL